MPRIRWQFVCERALASQAIAWFSAGHFSHVDCLLDDGRLLGARSDHAGGVPPGVQIRPANYTAFSRRVVMTLACTAEQQAAYYAFLDRQLAKPYDSEAIWAFVFNRDWRAHDSWICSELQAAAGEDCQIVHPLYLAANKITPVAWALAASAAGALVESDSGHDQHAAGAGGGNRAVLSAAGATVEHRVTRAAPRPQSADLPASAG
jgi:hypothetical protein